MVIHVLDQSFNLLGVVDDFISVIWRPAYYEVGDFELYINATSEAVKLLQKNRYLVRDSDVAVDEEGNVTYSNVMIIKNFTLSTSEENGDFLTYTGRELKYVLHQRIVWKKTRMSSKVEYGIRRLVTENAIAPTDSKRIIPNLVLGAEAGLSKSMDKQVTGKALDEAITEICATYGYGWEVFIYNSSLVFIVYEGVNRSYNQTEQSYVVFSNEFDNILNSEYQLQTEQYATTTLIGGEGEGLERICTSVGNEFSGLERYETFTDAGIISQNKGTEDEIPLEEYILLLQEAGKENLAALAITEGFSGEVLSDFTFKYGRDFYIGDTVTVKNRYGISKDVLVLSAIESQDESGTKLIPQFNI
jgi:hypothetical protein